MKEKDAFLGAEALGGGFEKIDEAFEGFVETEDGICAVLQGIGEEVVADDVLLEEGVFFGAVREDHVVDALEGVAHDFGIFGNDVEIVDEGTVPVLLAEFFLIQAAGDELEKSIGIWHCAFSKKSSEGRRAGFFSG